MIRNAPVAGFDFGSPQVAARCLVCASLSVLLDLNCVTCIDCRAFLLSVECSRFLQARNELTKILILIQTSCGRNDHITLVMYLQKDAHKSTGELSFILSRLSKDKHLW